MILTSLVIWVFASIAFLAGMYTSRRDDRERIAQLENDLENIRRAWRTDL